jgi:ribosome-associated protein
MDCEVSVVFSLFVHTRVHLASSTIRRAAAEAERPDRSLQLALTAAKVAEENRGRDIVILDMRELTSIFDYFVLATGSSRRQLHAISEEIDRTVRETLGDQRLGIEGYVEGRWILLDYGDVVIHLFDEEAREYYALEQLWCGAGEVPREADSPAPQ